MNLKNDWTYISTIKYLVGTLPKFIVSNPRLIRLYPPYRLIPLPTVLDVKLLSNLISLLVLKLNNAILFPYHTFYISAYFWKTLIFSNKLLHLNENCYNSWVRIPTPPIVKLCVFLLKPTVILHQAQVPVKSKLYKRTKIGNLKIIFYFQQQFFWIQPLYIF